MVTTSNKRIAKNASLLYIRMLLTIVVGLYTSRVVLNTLGVSDYGVYNVVGGIVAMLSFLSSALAAASQRFFSFELGRGDLQRLKNIFRTSVSVHIVLSIIVFIVAETIGLWFVNTYLNIAPDRMVAANWVYQCSILTFMLTVLSVPYNACIVAHEHMDAFAYISIVEVTLKLLIVYLLSVINYDKLIIYGIFVSCVALAIRVVYGIYCKRKFEECAYHFNIDKKLFNEMFAFAGWSVIGNLGFSVKDQVANIILNLFFGTIVNAARGIALQVNGIISGFSINFMMALNPQITKQYATGNVYGSMRLVYAGCRYSFFLLALITIPVMINIDYLLRLWLGIVPEYTATFLLLALICALINSMAMPLTTAIQATGNIKAFQTSICIIMMCEVPLAYLILSCGGKPYMAMYPTVLVTMVALFARFDILRKLVCEYDIKYFSLYIVGKNLIIGLFCIMTSYYVRRIFTVNFGTFILTSLISCLIVSIIVYTFGITPDERVKINRGIRNKIFRK